MRPTHPRQTLINSKGPKAPFEPPKLLPNLPNIVQLQQVAGPAKPRLQISEAMLKKLHPKERSAATATAAPPAPVQPPQGNLAARVSISPEGKQPGATGAPADSGSRGGKNAVGISISGGNPSANASGGGTKIIAPTRKLMMRPDPKNESEEAAERTGPPDFAALPPGARPEAVFAYKRVYTLNVNMPNLNSATGSWILNFSELRTGGENTHHAQQSAELSGPVPLQKVDPKYPPTLISERVAGEVILYAVIRRDGSVDSIQLVRGIDEQLDANAINALRQWKFRAGAKQGIPIELEAIVHIPFRLPENP